MTRVLRHTLQVCLLVALAGCSDAADLELASRGRTDPSAPVQASTKVVVNASEARVWSLLTDIKAWPSWQPDIKLVSVGSAPNAGTTFEWSSGAGTIHSRIALYDPQRLLSWTGHLYWFRAIHVWTLTSMPDGKTLVETRESMSGWPIGLLFSSADLLETDRRWLVSLKKKAETQNAPEKSS